MSAKEIELLLVTTTSTVDLLLCQDWHSRIISDCCSWALEEEDGDATTFIIACACIVKNLIDGYLIRVGH